MKITNLRSEKNGDRTRVAATVSWEDCDRPIHELYFETDDEFAQGLSCNPHAFLIGCIMPAMHYGEDRVFLDAEISPEIKEGLKAAMGWISHWYYRPDQRLVRIEAKTRSSASPVRMPERAGIFFSGGVDSLGTLRANRLNYALEHTRAIKDGLLVYGLETDKEEKFEHVVSSVSAIAQDAGLILIPIYTNVRHLNDDWMFWEHAFHDAVFSAIAHTFSRRLTTVSISSTYDIPNIQPYGTHPLLDINYSSIDMQIRHDGILLSRFDKTKLIADWDTALKNIRVCNDSELYQSGMLNCGKCNKCVRTMLALLALGVLDKTYAFPSEILSVGLLQSVIEIWSTTICFYEELIKPLSEKGHHDFARVIESKIDEYQKSLENKTLKSVLKETVYAKVKRFDRNYLDGNLKRFISQRRRNVAGQ